MGTRDRIKEAALKLFAELGVETATLADIASTVGIKTPSIYAHFTSKEALFLEIWSDLNREYGEFIGRIFSEADTMPLEERLYFLITQYGNFFRTNAVKYRLWSRLLLFPPPGLKDKVLLDTLELENSYYGRLHGLIAEGVARGRFGKYGVEDLIAALSIWREGYLMWLMFYGPEDIERQSKRVWEVLWNGLRDSRGSKD